LIDDLMLRTDDLDRAAAFYAGYFRDLHGNTLTIRSDDEPAG